MARLHQKVENIKEAAVIYCNYRHPLAEQRLAEAGNKLLKIETMDARRNFFGKRGMQFAESERCDKKLCC